MNAAWYRNRLRAMSPGEALQRGFLVARKSIWRRRVDWRTPEASVHIIDLWQRPAGLRPPEPLVQQADEMLDGTYEFLNIATREPRIDWHLDPQTGVRGPDEFALDINYRDPAMVGNVKNIWEKNRLHHLTQLAAVYAATNSSRFAKDIERQLLLWVDANPFLRGVNWTSSLELGIRLISLIWIERLLRESPVHERLFGRDGVLWPVIYRHQWLIARTWSRGSSANNHLIGEMAGLYLASTVWPYFRETTYWRALSERMLEREIRAQTFPCGLNREQAFAYHLFVLEFLLLCYIEAQRLARPLSATYRSILRRMLEVIPQVSDRNGNTPAYGDGDEGMALQLRANHTSRTSWLYRIGRSLLDADVPVAGDEDGRFMAGLIWPDSLNVATTTAAPTASTGFKDAGLFILAAERDTPRELFCIADAGPLGYTSLAAHGHADALAFTLNIGGTPVIVDPGTYVYHADPATRAYFRGTAAHNTVRVDGQDQSVAGGTFLWTTKARARLLEWQAGADGGMLGADHDGYQRLADPVRHRRTLQLKDGRLEITDDLRADKEHHYEFRLHFAPWCTVESGPDGFTIQWDGGQLVIARDPQLDYRIARGETEGGWYSRGFNLKEPAPTLIGSRRHTGPLQLKHRITIKENHGWTPMNTD